MQLVSRYLTRSLLLVTALLTASVTQAQTPQAPQFSPEQMQQMEQIKALREQGIQTQQKIIQLQQQALQSNPSLMQQTKEIQDMRKAVLKAKGFDVEKSIARLQELKAEFGKEGLTAEQKKKLQQEAMGVQQKLQQAQAAAMADPKLTQAYAKIEKDLIAEMTKLDPTVPEMLKKMDSLDKQMRQLMMDTQGKK